MTIIRSDRALKSPAFRNIAAASFALDIAVHSLFFGRFMKRHTRCCVRAMTAIFELAAFSGDDDDVCRYRILESPPLTDWLRVRVRPCRSIGRITERRAAYLVDRELPVLYFVPFFFSMGEIRFCPLSSTPVSVLWYKKLMAVISSLVLLFDCYIGNQSCVRTYVYVYCIGGNG